MPKRAINKAKPIRFLPCKLNNKREPYNNNENKSANKDKLRIESTIRRIKEIKSRGSKEGRKIVNILIFYTRFYQVNKQIYRLLYSIMAVANEQYSKCYWSLILILILLLSSTCELQRWPFLVVFSTVAPPCFRIVLIFSLWV